MGAPKQKWTQEEESALKSGVEKYGLSQWNLILKDPEFSGVLYLRSNVDLKDKWRNMSFMANKRGSHGKSKLAVKRTLSLPKQKEKSPATTTSLQSDEEMVDSKRFSSTGSSARQVSTSAPPRKPSLRLDNLRMKAIGTLKEPDGSNEKASGAYVEELYHAPQDVKQLPSTKLNDLTACGKLVKVNRKYMVPNSTQLSVQKKRSLRTVAGRQRITFLPSSPETDRDEVCIQTKKSQTDRELARVKSMSLHEAAAVAAHAVAEAETAVAEAEEASKEAEVAEAESEAAQAFAEEASQTLKDDMCLR